MSLSNGQALCDVIVRCGAKLGLIDPERCRAELSVDKDRGVVVFKSLIRGHEKAGRLRVEVSTEGVQRIIRGCERGREVPELATIVINKIREAVAEAVAAN